MPPAQGKPSSGKVGGSDIGRAKSSFTERHSLPNTGTGTLPKEKLGNAGSSNSSFPHRHADGNVDHSGRGKPDLHSGVSGDRSKTGTTNRAKFDPDLKLLTGGKPSRSLPTKDSFLKRHDANIGLHNQANIPRKTIDHRSGIGSANNHDPARHDSNHNHANRHHDDAHHHDSPHHHHAAHHSVHGALFSFGSPFGLYLDPWYGYGYGYGYGSGYRYGYPWSSQFYIGLPLFAYRPICSYGYSTGYGGFGGYGGYSSVSVYYPYQPTVVTNYSTPAADALPALPPEDTEFVDAEADFVTRGEAAFEGGKYDAAARYWRHALVDDPENGTLVLLLGQALFAGGKYEEAAGAIQHAVQILPDEKWGVVVGNYKELYPNMQEYTNQLRAAETARDKKDSPALRFLLGYHYGFLGYPKNAVRELDKTLELAPSDEIAKKLRDMFAAKLKPAEAPTTPPAPPRE